MGFFFIHVHNLYRWRKVIWYSVFYSKSTGILYMILNFSIYKKFMPPLFLKYSSAPPQVRTRTKPDVATHAYANYCDRGRRNRRLRRAVGSRRDLHYRPRPCRCHRFSDGPEDSFIRPTDFGATGPGCTETTITGPRTR
jgi:hypothetical protein